MILVFDLDDTLYPEIEYVKSGLWAVSKYISKKYDLNYKIIFEEMFLDLNINGRGLLFNNILIKHEIYSINELKKCISVYRNHNPDIIIYNEAKICLERFIDYKKYIITDGNIIVQRKKINALNIKHKFVKTIPTYQYGINFSKPSTLCFKKIIKWENCSPSDIVYIGDNPWKDFVNIKKEGINTVRVLTGGFKDLSLDQEHEAEYTLKSLDQLTINFIKKIKDAHK